MYKLDLQGRIVHQNEIKELLVDGKPIDFNKSASIVEIMKESLNPDVSITLTDGTKINTNIININIF